MAPDSKDTCTLAGMFSRNRRLCVGVSYHVSQLVLHNIPGWPVEHLQERLNNRLQPLVLLSLLLLLLLCLLLWLLLLLLWCVLWCVLLLLLLLWCVLLLLWCVLWCSAKRDIHSSTLRLLWLLWLLCLLWSPGRLLISGQVLQTNASEEVEASRSFRHCFHNVVIALWTTGILPHATKSQKD